MKRTRPRVDVNLQELDEVLDQARQAPLSEPDYQKIKDTLHTLVELLAPVRSTEKTNAVLPELAEAVPGERASTEDQQPPKLGHGRNAAAAFSGAKKMGIQHAKLKSGDRCPECEKGKVYVQREPKPLVRIIGQAPLTATVYELERLRFNACGQVFTAEEPAEVGPDKYDETTGAMIAQLMYGSGVPFSRLEKLQASLRIPLPAATQWEIIEEAAEVIKPALEELIRQAAQGEVLHNDDTNMLVLRQAHGRIHQRHCCDQRRTEDRTVLHRPPACGREPGRRIETACGGVVSAYSDVRCVIAQRAEADRRSGHYARTVSRTEEGSLLTSCRAFLLNAVTFSRCWQECTASKPKPGNAA
jgi:transposase IS66 family protein